MTDEIFGDIKPEGEIESPIELEKDQPIEPAEPPTEKEDGEDKEPSQKGENTSGEEKAEPFHKHPRFVKLTKSNREMKKSLEELRAMNESLRIELENRFSPKEREQEPIPDWFSELFGESPEAWAKYQSHTTKEREEMKSQILQEIAQEKEKEQGQNAHWQNWVKENIAELKEEGHAFDDNKFMKFMVDYLPTDEEGNIDFRKGIALYELIENKEKTKKVEAKKQIADKSMTQTKANEKSSFMTWAETKRKGWDFN